MNIEKGGTPEQPLGKEEQVKYESKLTDMVYALFPNDPTMINFYIRQISECYTLSEFQAMEEKLIEKQKE